MKKRNKIMILLTAIVLTVGMTAVPVMAKSSSYNGSCYFDGKKIVSDFSSSKIADKVTALQPGDKVQFKVKYTNKHNEKTNWYLSNEVLQTLEKADAARKVPKGKGRRRSKAGKNGRSRAGNQRHKRLVLYSDSR